MKRNWKQVEHVMYLSGCNYLQHLLPAWMKVSTLGSEMYSKLLPQEKCSFTLQHSNDYFTNATVQKLRKHSDIRDYLIAVQTFIADSVPNLKSISFCSFIEREDSNRDNIHLLFSYLNSKFAQEIKHLNAQYLSEGKYF